MNPKKAELLKQGNAVAIKAPNASEWRGYDKAIVLVPECGKARYTLSGTGFTEGGKGYVGVVRGDGVYRPETNHFYVDVVPVSHIAMTWEEAVLVEKQKEQEQTARYLRENAERENNRNRMAAINETLKAMGIKEVLYTESTNGRKTSMTLDTLERILDLKAGG